MNNKTLTPQEELQILDNIIINNKWPSSEDIRELFIKRKVITRNTRIIRGYNFHHRFQIRYVNTTGHIYHMDYDSEAMQKRLEQARTD